ncbi:flagellar assembly protein FliH [Solibacillus sp. CAU 1738]|uniref:flagellar assembly protein FliH n=1 Tax=Solibacillus sp. CAU 1738 TaxID=3140363 RepID=UPI003261AF6D
MSRIIRSMQAAPLDEEKVVKIEIKDMFQPIFGQELSEQVSEQPQLTIEEIVAERDKYLAEAQQQIAQEREQFEQFRNEQLDAIEQLKLTWEEEKLFLQQQAYDEGFASGYEEGIQKANAAMAEALKVANETVVHSAENARKYIEDQEFVILELALTAAERILDVTLDRDDEMFTGIVKRGLKEAREMKEVKVYVSPQYYENVTKNRDELAEMFPPNVPLLFFVNEDLHQTESYIETNHGRIVLTIDEQLNELRLKLNEILESRE